MIKLQNRLLYHRLAIGLFTVGMVWGLLFWAALLAGHLEASQFEATVLGETRLTTMRCPLLITPQDEGSVVTAVVENPTDREMRRLAYSYVSAGSALVIYEETWRMTLPPGGSEQIVLPIRATDAAWDWMVLARVVVLRNNPIPGQTGACGVIVAPVPLFTGGQLTAVSLLTILVGLVGGTFVWRLIERPDHGRVADITRAMLGVTLLILFGLALTIGGWWVPGIALYVITFFLALSLFLWFVAQDMG